MITSTTTKSGVPNARELKKLYPELHENCWKCKGFYANKCSFLQPTILEVPGHNAQVALYLDEAYDDMVLNPDSPAGKVWEHYASQYLTGYDTTIIPMIRCLGTPATLAKQRACLETNKTVVPWLHRVALVSTTRNDVVDIVRQEYIKHGGFSAEDYNNRVFRVDDLRRVAAGEIKGYKLQQGVKRAEYILQNSNAKYLPVNKISVIDIPGSLRLQDTTIGFDIEWNPDTNYIHTVGIYIPMLDYAKVLKLPENDAVLTQILENPNITLVNHNIVGDLAQLRRQYPHVNIKCKFIDTLILKNALEYSYPDSGLKDLAYDICFTENYWSNITKESFSEWSHDLAVYCAKDAWASYLLYEEFINHPEWYEMAKARDLDHKFSVPAVDMMYYGIGVDETKLTKWAQNAEFKATEVEQEIKSTYGIDNPLSPAQVKEKLHNFGYDVSDTSAKTLKALNMPFTRKILEVREWSKLNSNYIEGLREFIDPKDGRVRFSVLVGGTITGRLAVIKPAIQTVPPEAREMYCSIFGNEGELWTLDASQSEFRCLGYLSGCDSIIEGYRNGVDFHTLTSTTAKVDRSIAKTLNFAKLYGASRKRLINELLEAGKSKEEATATVEDILKFYEELGITDYQNGLVKFAKKHGYVESPYGRKGKRLGYTNIINFPIQSFSGDLSKERVIWLHDRFKEEGLLSRVWLELHDAAELDVYTPEAAKVEAIVDECKLKFREIPDILNYNYSVPLELDLTKHGKNWGK